MNEKFCSRHTQRNCSYFIHVACQHAYLNRNDCPWCFLISRERDSHTHTYVESSRNMEHVKQTEYRRSAHLPQYMRTDNNLYSGNKRCNYWRRYWKFMMHIIYVRLNDAHCKYDWHQCCALRKYRLISFDSVIDGSDSPMALHRASQVISFEEIDPHVILHNLVIYCIDSIYTLYGRQTARETFAAAKKSTIFSPLSRQHRKQWKQSQPQQKLNCLFSTMFERTCKAYEECH